MHLKSILCLLVLYTFECILSYQLLSPKDYEIINGLIKSCKNDTSMYMCLLNKGTTAIEKISGKDIRLFDGIILKKQLNKNLTKSNVIRDEIKGRNFNGDDDDGTSNFTKNSSINNDETSLMVVEGRRRNKIRVSKREKRYFWYSMMVLLGIFGLTGPIVMKTLTLIAGKALIASKIALLMVGSVALKKIFANDITNKNGIKVHTHTIPIEDEHDRYYQVEGDQFYY